jgi:tetraacyldisaccharide 4'-kinase
LLINKSLGLGNGWLLPAGPLREPKRAIERADALVLIESLGGTSSSVDLAVQDILHGKPLLHARLEPSALTYSEDGHWREAPLLLEGQRVVAVSGVANPAGFHAMIGLLGANLLCTLDYPDHYDYRRRDWEDIVAGARPAEMLITTEKDLVKLERFATPGIALYALHLTVSMKKEDERQLLELIMGRISRARLEFREETTNGTESGPARHSGMPKMQR